MKNSIVAEKLQFLRQKGSEEEEGVIEENERRRRV
jgi:hypothetical protein